MMFQRGHSIVEKTHPLGSVRWNLLANGTYNMSLWLDWVDVIWEMQPFK